jgi:hypothetical protein
MIVADSPDIYVQVVTYNHGPYVRQCLESLVSQTLRPGKIAIFDDCSTDNTVEIIRQFANRYDGLIELHLQPKNLGMHEHSLYIERHMRQGNFITIIEGDDWWDVRKLEEEYKALCRNPQAVVAYSNVGTARANGQYGCAWHEAKAGPMLSGRVLFPILMACLFSESGNPCRNYLIRRGPFDPQAQWYQVGDLKTLGDLHRLLGLACRYEFAATECLRPLVYYRRHGQGASRDHAAVVNANLEIYNKHDSTLATLPPPQEVAGRVYWECVLAHNRHHLPPESAAHYEPYRCLERSKAMFMQLPPRQRKEAWCAAIDNLRALTAHHIAELVAYGRVQDGFSLWQWHLQHDPCLADTRLVFSAQQYATLHREIMRPEVGSSLHAPQIRREIASLQAEITRHLAAGQPREAMDLWVEAFPDGVLRPLESAFALSPELYERLGAAMTIAFPSIVRHIQYRRPQVLSMIQSCQHRQSA